MSRNSALPRTPPGLTTPRDNLCPDAPLVVKPTTLPSMFTPTGSTHGSAKRLAVDFLEPLDDVGACTTLDEILIVVKKLVEDNKELKKELADVKNILKKLADLSSSGSSSSVVPIPTTYASVTKSSKKIVVINPSAVTSNPEETRSVIKTKLKPADYKLCGVSNTKKGGVVVECPSSAELNKLKSDAVARLGEDYVVTARIGRRPRVRVYGFSEEYNAVDLVKLLKDQNDSVIFDTSYISVAHIYKGNSSNSSTRFGAKLEVDADTFKRMIDAGKVSIGWDPCWVNEDFNIRRCYKCWGFNHVSSKCSLPQERCPLCSGNHHQKDCDSTVEKCTVCCDAVLNRHLKIDTNHTVFSKICPSYIHRLALECRNIDYGK